MTKKLYTAACILLIGTSLTFANSTIVNPVKQRTRIATGIASGELTKAETVSIHRKQVHANHVKCVAKADGVVTRRERARIKQAQAKVKADVYRKKHNKIHR